MMLHDLKERPVRTLLCDIACDESDPPAVIVVHFHGSQPGWRRVAESDE